MVDKFTEIAGEEVSFRLSHPAWALATKRLIDIIGSATAILLLCPVFALVAIAVKLSSNGPVFYKGERAGLNGNPFLIYKFRSMVVDAEALGGRITGTNDQRVTGVGNFIRRTKLDELPQFFNVLKGDMSLVGPRPEAYKFVEAYSAEEKIALMMRPGITDRSSVKFANMEELVGDNDPDQYYQQNIFPIKNRLRIDYVKNWSLSSDFLLLWQTFVVVLKKLFR